MNDTSQRSGIQFNLRTIFFWTFVLAMVCASVGPAIRSWDSERRWVLVGMLGFQSVLFCCVVAYSWRARLRAVAAAGPKEFGSSFVTRRYATAWQKIWAVFPLGVAIGYQVLLINVYSELDLVDLLPISLSLQLQCTWYLASNCVAYWFRVDARDMEICENGYIFGAFRFVAWPTAVSVRAGEFGSDNIVIVLRDQNGMKATYTFKVEANLRDAFVGHIQRKIDTVSQFAETGIAAPMRTVPA